MSIILENIFSTEFVYMWIRVVTPILLPALGAPSATGPAW